VVQTNPNAFNGTSPIPPATRRRQHHGGVNYTFSPNLSAYARYEHSYETNGVNPFPTGLILYEGGVTFATTASSARCAASAPCSTTRAWGGGVDPANPNLNLGFFGNSATNGVDLDATYRPELDVLHPFSLHVQATYQDSTFNNVSVGEITINNQNIGPQADAFYNGKTPGQYAEH
jgi:iron complex outermembrane receptor protein